MSNSTVELLAKRLDKPVATLIVSEDLETKRFIEVLKAASDRGEPFDLSNALRTTASPVAPENLEKIQRDVLAVALGQASRRR